MLSALGFGAWFTELVGIHAVFGAFVLGAAMPRRPVVDAELQRVIEPLTTALLVPLFFVYSGLNTQIALVNSAWLWAVTAVVFARRLPRQRRGVLGGRAPDRAPRRAMPPASPC